jgi:hypothetical protein
VGIQDGIRKGLAGALLLAFTLSHILEGLAPQAILFFSDHEHEVQADGEHGHFLYALSHTDREPSDSEEPGFYGSEEADADHLIHLDNSRSSFLASAKAGGTLLTLRPAQPSPLLALAPSPLRASRASAVSHLPLHPGPQARSVVLRV